MRFRKETIEWKDDSTNRSRNKQVVVSRLTHIHVLEKTPSPECLLWDVAHNRTLWECMETTRERRETGTMKKVWTDGTDGTRRTEKTDRIYEENRIISWNMNKDYV
jgi:hypothetical protein